MCDRKMWLGVLRTILIICVFGETHSGRFRGIMGNKCSPDEKCIEIRKCKFFVQLLDTSPIPRPRHVITKIRQKSCGFNGNSPKVCCKDHEDDVVDSLRSDLKQHPNFHLLPRDICGPIHNNYRITSGSKTDIMEFPWMALLVYFNHDEGFEFKCGGTIINERYVLTAAHCVSNLSLIGVRLGEHNINTNTDCDSLSGNCAPPILDYYVEDAIVHPDYKANSYQNDIALIRIATPANFSYENIRPICLPVGVDVNLDWKFVVVSGWGVTEVGYKSAVLLKTSVPVMPNKDCQTLYKGFTDISNKQICAGGYLGRDSCGGDSGGPLKDVSVVDGIPRFVQHGVVSYGPRHCGTAGRPGVYTSIKHFMKWILDNIKESR